jgi:hypothetical protein
MSAPHPTILELNSVCLRGNNKVVTDFFPAHLCPNNFLACSAGKAWLGCRKSASSHCWRVAGGELAGGCRRDNRKREFRFRRGLYRRSDYRRPTLVGSLSGSVQYRSQFDISHGQRTHDRSLQLAATEAACTAPAKGPAFQVPAAQPANRSG